MQGFVLLFSVLVFVIFSTIIMVLVRSIQGARKKTWLKKGDLGESAHGTQSLYPTEGETERDDPRPVRMLAAGREQRQVKKKPSTALSRIGNLTPLKWAIIWVEILGTPGGASENEPR